MRWIVPLLAVAGLAAAAWLLWPRPAVPPPEQIDAASLARVFGTGAQGFAKFTGRWDYSFPRDAGPHPAYRGELWDLSGQLTDSQQRRYGFRLSFVRIGLTAPGTRRESELAATAVMTAGLALIPAGNAQVLQDQRTSRTALGLAGSQGAPMQVWVEDWRLEQDADGSLHISARAAGGGLELSLRQAKAPVTAEQAGLFAAGKGPGFHFYFEPRLSAQGRLVTAAGAAEVQGSAWLDRAWGEVGAGLAGGAGQLAVNRFALQLDDGSELMCIHLRRRAGGGTPIPTCLLVAEDGKTRLLQRRELTLAPVDGAWASPRDGTRYPLHWRLAMPAADLVLDIRPLREAQELRLGAPFWSGIVSLQGTHGGRTLTGSGRMDLSGYGTGT
jgi:predicted secreted hydrolase